jgi:hypothetical protein
MAATKSQEMRGKIVTGWGKRALGAVACVGLLGGAARDARADGNRVKGTVGGAMLGAEVVMLTESAFRLRPAWMYLAGGAGGGLLGGYVGNRLSGGSNRPPSFLLAGGIALIIPSIMGVLTATQYEPIGTIRQDRSDDGSNADDGDPDAADPDSADPDSAEPDPDGSEPESMDGVDKRGPDARASAPRLELPTIGLAQAFSRDELAHFRVRQATELHLALLRGVF